MLGLQGLACALCVPRRGPAGLEGLGMDFPAGLSQTFFVLTHPKKGEPKVSQCALAPWALSCSPQKPLNPMKNKLPLSNAPLN